MHSYLSKLEDGLEHSPLLVPCLAFALGITLLNGYVSPLLSLILGGVVGFLLALLSSWALRNSTYRQQFYRWGQLGLRLSVACVAFTLGLWRAQVSWQDLEQSKIPTEQTECKALALSSSIPTVGAYRSEIRLLYPSANAGTTIRLYTTEPHRAGDTLSLGIRHSTPVSQIALEHEGYARYLLSRDIAGTMQAQVFATYPSSTTHLYLSPLLLGQRLREHLLESVEYWGLSPQVKNVAIATSLGYLPSDEEGQTLREHFAHSGLAHLLAVSGFHLGLVVWLVGYLLSQITIVERHLWIRPLLLIGFAWGFCLLTGASTPTLRACLMLSLYLVSRSLSRPPIMVQILSLSALIQLWFTPYLIYSASFTLSYIAVLSIHLYYPILLHLVEGIQRAGLRHLWQALCLSLSAQVLTLPLSAYFFGYISWSFVWTALPALALASLSIPLFYLCLLCSSIPLLGSSMIALLEWTNQALIATADLGSQVPWLQMQESPPLYLVLLYIIVASTVAFLSCPEQQTTQYRQQ